MKMLRQIFASGKLPVDGAIVLTASHNPGEYNGMKFCKTNAVPVGENSGYLRGAGITEIITDADLRENIYVKIPFLKEFWKTSTDKGYTLLKLNVSEVEHMKPGEFIAKKYEY